MSERMISGTNNANEELAWKNCWNWNLCDAAFGHLNLDIADGRVSGVLQSQGKFCQLIGFDISLSMRSIYRI